MNSEEEANVVSTVQPSICALLSSILASAFVAVASGGYDEARQDTSLEDIYQEFASVGMFDLELSNEDVNRLIAQGIAADNPRIVELTIRAMGAHAVSQNFEERHLSLPVRTFATIPGLKHYLIGHWRDKIAQEGLVRKMPPPAGESSVPSAANPWVEIVESSPDWLIVPHILANAFPQDGDVHQLIWEMHAYLEGDAARTLVLLNAGRFRTPEADRLRMDSLAADDGLTLRHAADGIAMSKPTGGLDALGSAVRKDPANAHFLIDAIVSYGPAAIPLIRDIPLEGLAAATQVKVVFGLESLKHIAKSTP